MVDERGAGRGQGTKSGRGQARASGGPQRTSGGLSRPSQPSACFTVWWTLPLPLHVCVYVYVCVCACVLKSTRKTLRVCVCAPPGGQADAPPLGVDDLRAALVALVPPAPRPPPAPGCFLFAIDHCFPIKGQGSVLTGTVLQVGGAARRSCRLRGGCNHDRKSGTGCTGSCKYQPKPSQTRPNERSKGRGGRG